MHDTIVRKRRRGALLVTGQTTDALQTRAIQNTSTFEIARTCAPQYQVGSLAQQQPGWLFAPANLRRESLSALLMKIDV